MGVLSHRSILRDLPFVLTLLILAAHLSASTGTGIGPKEHTIIATGVGRRIVTTSIALVRLAVEDRKRTAVAVQASVAAKTSTLIAYLNSSTEKSIYIVDKLQTSGIALRPELDYTQSPANTTGYTASNTVSFEVPISRSGEVLDTAVKSGATRIISVEFRAMPNVSQDARLDAIEDAVERAQAEARAAARAAYLALGTMAHIRIDDTFYQVGVEHDQSQDQSHFIAVSESAPSTPIIGKDQVIEARVTVTFLLD